MDGSIFKHDRILRIFSRDGIGSLKNDTEFIKGSNCNQINILKGSHQNLDTITV